MDATTIKTRHGLILQGAVAEALRRGGIPFKENCQYDADCERPDFLLPNASKPKFTIEVHQTDARNSFQMKILRSFTAVTEAKAFFGESLVSVNVLFGDPDVEVPASNVRALFGFFDVNTVPRKDAKNPEALKRLEISALTLASTEGLSVADATVQLIRAESAGIDGLSALLTNSLRTGRANPILTPLWQLERNRLSTLGTVPAAGARTYYKRGILQSLYLSDAHFAELQQKRDPNKCSSDLRGQLVLTGLAESIETTRGYVVALYPTIRDFINDPKAAELRSLCERRLDVEPAMHWFFEDIRDIARREVMVSNFLSLISKGREKLNEALLASLLTDNYKGVQHTRSWVADLMPIYVGESHNSFNRRMFRHPNYQSNLGNPFNNLAIKSPRLGRNQDVLANYADVAVSCFEDARASAGNKLAKNADELMDRLVIFRLGAAIKLQKLNPLYLVVEKVADGLNLQAEYKGTQSFLSDLSGTADPVGKYDLYHITNGRLNVLVNAVAVHDNHGDDKSKEWGARRLSTLYRFTNSIITRVLNQQGIFVIDGEWEQKDVNRLNRSGWDYVVRLSELEPLLRKIFKK